MAYYYPSSFCEMYTWAGECEYLWDHDGIRRWWNVIMGYIVKCIYIFVLVLLYACIDLCLGIRLLPFPFSINDYCNFHCRIYSVCMSVSLERKYRSVYSFVMFIHRQQLSGRDSYFIIVPPNNAKWLCFAKQTVISVVYIMRHLHNHQAIDDYPSWNEQFNSLFLFVIRRVNIYICIDLQNRIAWNAMRTNSK